MKCRYDLREFLRLDFKAHGNLRVFGFPLLAMLFKFEEVVAGLFVKFDFFNFRPMGFGVSNEHFELKSVLIQRHVSGFDRVHQTYWEGEGKNNTPNPTAP